ncbi:MAG: NADH-quinone oxidoreductase subunit N [Polyangiaceae bacterium]|nr:NADH-quinone oxidoreductase subunit N [Polyangiaceae bacterium]
MPSLDNVQSLTYFLPEVALIAGVLLVVCWDLVARGTTRVTGIVVLTLAALGTASAVAAGYLFKQIPEQRLFFGLLAFDGYAHLFRIVFPLISALVLVFAVPARETGAGTRKRKGAGEFFSLLLIITLGLNLMAMSRNLLMIYLSLELVSVMSFVMAGFKLNDRRSSEGALKYVIFGGMASGVMLYGMSWLYGIAKSLDLADIASRVTLDTADGNRVPLAVLVAVICIMAGFGYKISAAPFHMWTPDVYEGAPTSVTALLSVGPKAAGFAVLVRFFSEALHATTHANGSITPWAVLGGVLAMLTMFVGNFTALNQDNVKRMLAYSSIAHAGYMLLGFCVFNNSGVRAIIFYIVAYALMNLGAFLVVAAVAERNNDKEDIEAFHGLGSRAPLLALAMAVFLFSLTGLPPMAGFIGKFYIFAALVEAGGTWNWVLATVGVINSAVSLFYYARVLRAMYLTEPADDTPLTTRPVWNTTALALAVPTFVIGVYWSPVYDLITRSLSVAR